MDWVAAGITVAGSYLLSKKRRAGWLLFSIASLFWVAYGIWSVNSIPIVILNVILIINAIRGFRNWRKGEVL